LLYQVFSLMNQYNAMAHELGVPREKPSSNDPPLI
jgi:hypothetical protein